MTRRFRSANVWSCHDASAQPLVALFTTSSTAPLAGCASSARSKTICVLAPRSSGKENQSNVKPFIGTLRVTNPVRQSRASSRKRVLRGGGRPPLRSVDSEIKRCVIEPRNFLVVSPRLGHSRGSSLALATPGPTGVPGHTGVGGTWRMIARVSRELGRPCRLHRNCRLENRVKNSRLIHSYVLS